MKQNFKVEIQDFKSIHVLPEYWSDRRYKELLDEMEYGDTTDLSSQDLQEMCYMSLADNEPQDAAAIVLNNVFKERLNEGQIENLSHEMIEEKMWEEYADIEMHESFFNAHQILFDAYNGKFPNTEGVSFNIKISNDSKESFKVFNDNTESAVIRLLVNGMPENALIKRLYKEELLGTSFTEAEHIIWSLDKKELSDTELLISIVSSNYWFHDLKFIEQFEGNTHADIEDVEDED